MASHFDILLHEDGRRVGYRKVADGNRVQFVALASDGQKKEFRVKPEAFAAELGKFQRLGYTNRRRVGYLVQVDGEQDTWTFSDRHPEMLPSGVSTSLFFVGLDTESRSRLVEWIDLEVEPAEPISGAVQDWVARVERAQEFVQADTSDAMVPLLLAQAADELNLLITSGKGALPSRPPRADLVGWTQYLASQGIDQENVADAARKLQWTKAAQVVAKARQQEKDASDAGSTGASWLASAGGFL